MPFFVAVHHQVGPGQRAARVETIRRDFAVSPARHSGRKFARLFEHLDDATRLLGIEEWKSQAEFASHEQAVAYRDLLSASGPPPRYDELSRLQHYRHMPHPPAALACAAITSPAEQVSQIESFICEEERGDALVAEGLVLRAVYRVISSPGRLLVLHGWQSLEHLQRHLADSARVTGAALAGRGATVDQFAGRVAAEYSWLQS